jgi:DNA ligase-1
VKPFVSSTLRVIEQVKISKQEDVKMYFDAIVKIGGEGLVLRNPEVQYYTGRNKKSLKYKPFFDAECRVVSILKGRGKYKDLMGAIACDYKGKLIKIGSGFSDEERKNPLKIGTLITFKYYGLTRLGNPKYSVFLRIRMDENLSL